MSPRLGAALRSRHKIIDFASSMKEVGLVEKVGPEIGNARNSIGITIRELILKVCRGKH